VATLSLWMLRLRFTLLNASWFALYTVRPRVTELLCFVKYYTVGLARHPDNRNLKYKERNSFRSKIPAM